MKESMSCKRMALQIPVMREWGYNLPAGIDSRVDVLFIGMDEVALG